MTESHARPDGEDGATPVPRPARWPEDSEVIRRLFADYRQWVADHGDPAPSSQARVTEGLALIDRLIGELPRVYQPPRGDILLWFEGNSLVACGALREVKPKVGEIRRIYIRADYRGGEFGRPFVQALIARAHDLRFEKIQADTLANMQGAIDFYTELGFRPAGAHWPHPAAGALFFEREVVPAAETPPATKRRKSGE